MKQFESISTFGLEEAFSTEKPKNEAGYKIERSMGPSPDNPKKLVRGYRKVKIKKSASKHISKAKATRRAKKAAMTKKRNPTKMKKAAKRAVKTRKANKK